MNNTDLFLIALRRVIRATDLHSKFLVKNTGLTAPQLLLLNTLEKEGRCTLGQLANQMSLSQATVTSIIDRLEKRDLVQRERSNDDRRKVYASLTMSAKDVLRDAPALLQDNFTQQFSSLHDWEQSLMISSLQRIAQMMDAHHLGETPPLDIETPDRTRSTIKLTSYKPIDNTTIK